MKNIIKKVPNTLTMLRICLVPVIFIFMYIDNGVSNCMAIFFAFIACISDFFDGKIARKYNCSSTFGRCMDPIADKILVMTLILMLVYFHRVWIVPSIVILLREFVVSGVREFVSKEKNIIIHVSKLAKIKTSMQMFSLLFVMVFYKNSYLCFVGNILFTFASILAIITCVQYILSVKKVIFSR